MNNIRFYKVVIIILVLVNVSTLIFLWFGKPRTARVPVPGHASEFLIRELMLTPMQQDEFGKLSDENHERMRILQEQDRKLHYRFFETLFLPNADTSIAKIFADSIIDLRMQMELLTFEHFRQIKQMLTEEQKHNFHRVFRQAIECVMPPLPPPPPQSPPPPPPPPPLPDKPSK